MASVHQHPKSANWSVKFRFGGKQYCKSLKTTDRRKAEGECRRIEQTLLDMERGRLVLPPHADLWTFIRTDGKMTGPQAEPVTATLSDLFAAYFDGQVGQKEENTLRTEGFHRSHLERHFGKRKQFRLFTPGDVQGYIAERAKKVGPETIKKEVATLKMLLRRADRLVGVKPAIEVGELFRGLAFPKGRQKPAFMTWEEIEAQVARTKPDPEEEKRLWDRVFLDTNQVTEFLDWAEGRLTRNPIPFFVPLLTAAAHTGARLSELARSQVEDWLFDAEVVVLREKKKSQQSETQRRVDLTPRLTRVMQRWFGTGHPGGRIAFCRELNERLDTKNLRNVFDRFVARSKWAVLKGYHVFRHSFASNLARAGEDERVVDQLMGHQTEEMRRRYRHLFPEQRKQAVRKLFAS